MKKFGRKLISFLLAVCVLAGGAGLLSRPANALNANAFTDFPGDAWYRPYLPLALSNGLFFGVSDNAFEPGRAISRGEAVAVLGRAHEALSLEKVAEPAEPPFEDVRVTRFYARYVAWAKENNILSGRTATTFAPNQPVTQQELAVMFAKYIALAQKQDLYPPLEDVDVQDVSDWAVESVRAISGFEIIERVHWRPQEEASRGACVAFFERLFEKLSYQPEDKETPRQKFTFTYQEKAPEEVSSSPESSGADNGTVSSQPDAVVSQPDSSRPEGESFQSVLDSNGSYQLIGDYAAYTALVKKLEAQGKREEQKPDLEITEETFREHDVLAVEIQTYGMPKWDAVLGSFEVNEYRVSGLDEGSQPTESGSGEKSYIVELTYLSTGHTQARSDKNYRGCVFFFEVPKNVEKVLERHNAWTEDY